MTNTTSPMRTLSQLASEHTPDVTPLQQQALAHFRELGFPDPRHEEWKYTSTARLQQQAFTFSPAAPTEKALLPLQLHTDSTVLLFINGRFAPQHSSALISGNDLTVSTLAALRAAGDPRLDRLGSLAPHAGEAFNALNTALHQDGLFIDTAANAEVTQPVVVYYLTTDGSAAMPRNLVWLGANSSLQLIECTLGGNSTENFTNLVSEIYTANDARLNYTKLQLAGAAGSLVDYTRLVQEQGSRAETTTVTINGSLVRNNLHFAHKGTQCTSLLNGLYLAGKNSLVDNHTLVDHAVPHCYSNELYKGVVGSNGQAVFNGKVLVRPDAQKTNAYQRNANILLSDEGVVNTKPQLEIFADDVKCSHGATTGQMDEEALFYMRSRGIGLKEARTLLLEAFAAEILEHVHNGPVQEQLTRLIAQHLQTL